MLQRRKPRLRTAGIFGIFIAMVLVGLTLTSAGAFAAGGMQAANSPSAYRTVLDQYCVTCHNERLQTGGLGLDTLDMKQIVERAEVWEKVVQKLRAESMPPPGRRRPDKGTYRAFAEWLEAELDQVTPNPGKPALHRLNRTEYANSIRDLLALEIDGESLLPRDDTGYGFDNSADHLMFSPLLLERYMSAASKIARLAIGDPVMHPVAETYVVPQAYVQDDRMSEDLPFGSRGAAAIQHYFPVDGEYYIRLRLQRGALTGSQQLGATEPEQQIDLRVDGARVAVFTAGGETLMDMYQVAEEPTSADDAGPKYSGYLQMDFETRLAVKAGLRTVSAALLRRPVAPEGLMPSYLPVASINYGGKQGAAMSLDAVQIEGPYEASGADDTAPRRRIFVCQPSGSQDEERCATQIVTTLAQRAYRRPVTNADVEPLLAFYKSSRAAGTFETGIRSALERLLVDPQFLFRVEAEPVDVAPGTPYRLDDLAIASRLSFFLWSSIPDDELVGVAARGELQNPAVLARQVQRMLADPRSRALVDNFAAQWLYLRNVRAVTPDANEYPRFDDNLREAFERETELFVESQLREDRSVIDLLTANYTFVNERLARNYGIPGVYGSRFRRVTYPDDRRAGLLGHGSVLTVTSYSTRTSPVIRGKWVLENILGQPPPPPPPDVPALAENNELEKPQSVRERLERHRANPVCASCHSTMDPIGFALENFNGIGAWRDMSEAGAPVDASGTMPDGTTFQGPAELRTALLARPMQFVTTFTTKLLTYALGRGVEYSDAPVVRKIIREAAPSDYRWSSLILGIVKSTPFQMAITTDQQSGASQGE